MDRNRVDVGIFKPMVHDKRKSPSKKGAP